MIEENRAMDMSAYEAAHSAAVLVDRSDLGVLKITGETRLDLLHRMSTQAVTGLKSGEGAATILTSDIGRIIDRLIVYASSDTVYALTSEKNADSVARYLMRYVFFQDDFHLEDLSADTAIFGVYGPRASAILEQAGLPAATLPLHHWRRSDWDGIDTYIHRTDPVVGDGCLVMCNANDKERLRQKLLNAGLHSTDEPMFDLLRIESGLKRFGHELTSEYIPLEADLWSDVSFNKGCYIGQEIIARMESRGRLAKRLVRLYPSEPVAEGDDIMAEGKSAGTITSAAVAPSGPVALGFVKTAVLDLGATLAVGDVPVLRVEAPTVPEPSRP